MENTCHLPSSLSIHNYNHYDNVNKDKIDTLAMLSMSADWTLGNSYLESERISLRQQLLFTKHNFSPVESSK